MLRYALAVALFASAAAALAAGEEKAPKADVVVKDDAKAAAAKPGQTVEVQVKYPVVPPFPDDFEVTVDGKAVKSKTYAGQVKGPGGQPVVGAGLKLVQFQAAGEGKQKVVVGYKKGEKKETRTIELTVKE